MPTLVAVRIAPQKTLARDIQPEPEGEGRARDHRQDDAADRGEEGRAPDAAHRGEVGLEAGGREDRQGTDAGEEAHLGTVADDVEQAGSEDEARPDLADDPGQSQGVSQGRADLGCDEEHREGQQQAGQAILTPRCGTTGDAVRLPGMDHVEGREMVAIRAKFSVMPNFEPSIAVSTGRRPEDAVRQSHR